MDFPEDRVWLNLNVGLGGTVVWVEQIMVNVRDCVNRRWNSVVCRFCLIGEMLGFLKIKTIENMIFGKIILYVWFLNYIEKPSAWLGCVVCWILGLFCRKTACFDWFFYIFLWFRAVFLYISLSRWIDIWQFLPWRF